jgi:hypothetical protein
VVDQARAKGAQGRETKIWVANQRGPVLVVVLGSCSTSKYFGQGPQRVSTQLWGPSDEAAAEGGVGVLPGQMIVKESSVGATPASWILR